MLFRMMIVGCSLMISLAMAESNAVFQVRKVSEPMTIDGKANEACWARASMVSLDHFYDIEKPNDDQASTMKMLWDDEHIYVLFEAKDKFIAAKETVRDGIPYLDDCAEVFFVPVPEPIPMHFAFEVNLLKTPNDIVVMNHQYKEAPVVVVKSYNPDYEVGVQISGTMNDNSDVDEGWSMEWAIPLKAFHMNWIIPPIEEGVQWRFMAVRKDRNDLDSERATMATCFPLINGSRTCHRPESFGLMEFCR